MEEKIKILLDALEFYADFENNTDEEGVYRRKNLIDGGLIAEEALKKYGKSIS